MASAPTAGDPAQASGAMPPRLSLFLWNARGFGADRGKKFASFLLWAQTSMHQVFVLTETHLPGDPLLWLGHQPGAAGGFRWKGSYFWTPGFSHSKGVLVLFKDTPLLSGLPASCQFDAAGVGEAEGRVVRVDFSYAGSPFTLLGAYAPNEGPARCAFFRDVLSPLLPQDRLILLGADFNCVESRADRTDSLPDAESSRHVGATALGALREAHSLQDVWRQAVGPARVDFTHWSGRSGSGARLDRWLLSGALLSPGSGWDAYSAILGAGPELSDHLPVTLSLQGPAPPCVGKRPWRLPLQLLTEPLFKLELLQLVRSYRASCPPGQAILQWQRCKAAIARACQEHSKELRRRHVAELRAKARAADRAKALLLDGAARGAAVGAAVLTWRSAAAAVTQVHRDTAAKALVAHSVLDHLYGDTSTFWFHLRGRSPAPPTVFQTLRPAASAAPGDAADLSSLQGTHRALEIAVAHFSGDSPTGIFRRKEGVDASVRSTVLGRLGKSLTPARAAAAERPLCLPGPPPSLPAKDELHNALLRCQRGKAPGLDGLPYEFYVALWQEVGPFLVEVFHDAFTSPLPDPLAPLLEGLICPVHKPGRPADLLAGYRPITLLNADLKLLAKTIADRMHLPLDYLVSSLQSAFIEGRDIAENVLFHLRLAEYLHDSQHPAWLLITDLAGAYDNVDRQFLLDCLAAYGFKLDGHVRWASLLHTGSTARVLVNGFVSWPFPVLSGLAQGSPISTVYWTVVAEPLIQRLNSLAAQGRIRTPVVDGLPFLGPHAFADDIKQPVCDAEVDGGVLVEVCAEFAAASGVPLNVDKCQAVPLSAPSRLLQPATATEPPTRVAGAGFLIPAADKPPKLLGVPFTADFPLAMRLAYDRRLAGMLAAAGVWSQTQLNFIGRAHVAKQCIASVTVYHATFLRPDAGLARRMQGVCRGFAARSNIPGDAAPIRGRHSGMQPKELVAALPWKLGGANLVHLPSVFAALAAKNIVRVFGPHRHRMKTLMLRAFAEADRVTGLASWVITAPATPSLVQALPPRLQDYVRGLEDTKPHRIVAPDAQGFYSVMAEPLGHNRQIVERQGSAATCFSPASLGTPEGRRWRYIRDLRAAVGQGSSLPADVRADVDRVLPLLPAAWRAHVLKPGAPPRPGWCCAQLEGGLELVCCGAGPPAPTAALYVVLDMGRMEPVSDAPLPTAPALRDATWQPCLVVSLPKPPRHWTPEDFLEVQQAKENKQEHTPEDKWLAGPWDSLVLDPTVWGYGSTPLHDFTVKAARLRCLLLQATATLGPRFSHAWGMRPAAWPDDAPAAAALPNRDVAALLRQRLRAGVPAVAVGAPLLPQPPGPGPMPHTGLATLEQAWTEAAALKRAEEAGDRPPGERDSAAAPLWMVASPPRGDGVVGRRRARDEEPPDPGPGGGSRAAAVDDTVDALARPQGPPPAFAAAWSRLRAPNLSRVHRTTAWRIMHGALLVNGLRAFVDPRLPFSAALCTHPACARSGCVETITHALFACPAVLPVLRWLQDFWEAVAEERPPMDPGVLLADDHRAWAPARLRALWTLVRVAVLHETWHCRSARADLDGSLCAAVVTRVVMHLQSAITRDWALVDADVRQLSDLPEDYFRGRKPELSLAAFLERWAHRSVLCHVHEGALVLRLSLQLPVPVPVA